MANAKKASMNNAEQKNESTQATAVALTYEELEAQYNSGKIEPNSPEFELYLELDKKKKIEDLYLRKNKFKEVESIKEKISKLKLQPSDVFDEDLLKSLYAKKTKSSKGTSGTGKGATTEMILFSHSAGGKRPRVYAKGHHSKKPIISLFELANTWEDFLTFQVNSDEVNTYLASDEGKAELKSIEEKFNKAKK